MGCPENLELQLLDEWVKLKYPFLQNVFALNRMFWAY